MKHRMLQKDAEILDHDPETKALRKECDSKRQRSRDDFTEKQCWLFRS